MKKRVAVFLNFVAFNLLFFALYLNFIHKDAEANPAIQQQMHSSIEASYPERSLESGSAKKRDDSENVTNETKKENALESSID